MGSDRNSLPVLVGLCWLQTGLGEDAYAEARDRWKGQLPASAGPLYSNQARLLPARLTQERQGLRKRLLLLCEAPYLKTGRGGPSFSPCGRPPHVWDTSFLSPPNPKAPQCLVLCRAHSAPVPEVTGKAQTGLLPFYQPQKKEKAPPPVPPPAPPPATMNEPPIVIICCCTCYDVCVRKGPKVRVL